MTRMASSSRWPRSLLSTAMASYSRVDSWPTPTPATRRPPERLSMVASALAVVTGLRMDMSSTPVPNLSFSVRAATMAMATSGSGTQGAPTIRSVNHRESQPWDSSVSRYWKKAWRPCRATAEAPLMPMRTFTGRPPLERHTSLAHPPTLGRFRSGGRTPLAGGLEDIPLWTLSVWTSETGFTGCSPCLETGRASMAAGAIVPHRDD